MILTTDAQRRRVGATLRSNNNNDSDEENNIISSTSSDNKCNNNNICRVVDNRKKQSTKRRRMPYWGLVLCAVLVIAGQLHQQQRRRCRPQPDDSKLIEYYIHGRGNGHWIGSLVTIEELQRRGYQVRIFAGRDMPAPPAEEDPQALLAILDGKTPGHAPVVPDKHINYTSIDRLGNDLGVYQVVKRFLQRLRRDKHLTRPVMIISDADLIGVMQAWLHSIPSLYITHGQVFVDSKPPKWLTTHEQKRAWKWEGTKNGLNSFLADNAIGFNHVPVDDLVRVSVRQEIKDMALRRHVRLHHYHHHREQQQQQQQQQQQEKQQEHNPIVATYFRDSNGGVVIREFVRAGYDVIVFGGGSDDNNDKEEEGYDGPGRVIAVKEAAYFVPFMGIADGVVASAGCQLVAECVHAQIPMLALYKEADPEHELNVLMAQRLSYKDGRRLLFGTTFESLGRSKSSLPTEVELFMKQVKDSKASASFYAAADANWTAPSGWTYKNELEDGTPEHLEKVFEVLDEVEDKNQQCSRRRLLL